MLLVASPPLPASCCISLDLRSRRDNFVTSIPRGTHLVEVLGAAGSGIDPGNRPTVTHLVLTLEYR
jgi:hypothetical protein